MPATSVLIRCSSCGTLNRIPVDKLASRPICGKCKTALHYPAEPINVTTATFDREMNDWRELLLVEFWSLTCGYCQMVEPVMRDLARWKAGRLKILMVNIQQELPLAQRFETMATPTFILFRNGRQLARIDGAPKEKIDMVRWVEQFL
ncbi:MAG: thiol reductase thioredoxin [Nitrospirae bacterium]|nr:thiol reductase thioredoxin [Nitrospirota bacterium]NTW65185.1 thiol reductase thioredoxin [Nitrospirota bacterium]